MLSNFTPKTNYPSQAPAVKTAEQESSEEEGAAPASPVRSKPVVHSRAEPRRSPSTQEDDRRKRSSYDDRQSREESKKPKPEGEMIPSIFIFFFSLTHFLQKVRLHQGYALNNLLSGHRTKRLGILPAPLPLVLAPYFVVFLQLLHYSLYQSSSPRYLPTSFSVGYDAQKRTSIHRRLQSMLYHLISSFLLSSSSELSLRDCFEFVWG